MWQMNRLTPKNSYHRKIVFTPIAGIHARNNERFEGVMKIKKELHSIKKSFLSFFNDVLILFGSFVFLLFY